MRAAWRSLAVTVLLAVAGGAYLVATAGAPAVAAGRSGSAAVGHSGSAAQGVNPTPPKSLKITFFFGLKRPEAQARVAFFAVSQPGSASYRRFLSLKQVSARYGATPATKRALVSAVKKLKLGVSVDPSGVFARVSGTVAQLDRAFKVHIVTGFEQDPNTFFFILKGSGRLNLPADMRSLVQDVVPSYSHSASLPGLTKRVAQPGRAATAKPRRTGTWVGGCAKAKASGAFSYAQVRKAYGITPLGGGSNARVAILNVGEGVQSRDITDNAKCFGYPKLRSRILLSDGQQAPFGPGTFEPQEDLALVRGMAPALKSITFTQVWGAAELWFLGVSQVLDAPNLPDSLSISYGECERDIRGPGSSPTTRAGAALMDALLVRIGLAGVSSFASAGDFGSTCNGRPFTGVAWPSSSPFVTAVGGSQLTLTPNNERKREVVWSDLKYETRKNGAGAGGGGFSVYATRPPYQRGLGLPGNRRTTPDVSAMASEFPGYPVVLSGMWVNDGGTSASAPLVASAMAVISANLQRRGRPPIGPANGLFYWLAKKSPRTYWDIVSGNNGYLPKVPARRAKRGYDLASGLGVPKFQAVAAGVPRPGWELPL